MTTRPSSQLQTSRAASEVDGSTESPADADESLEDLQWRSLCDAARAGDSDALGTLCERLRGFLSESARRQMQRRLQPKIGASDVVQQSLIQACRQFEQFRGSSEAEFRSWVRRILQNHTIDAARRFNETFMRDARREVSLDPAADAEDLAAPTKTASSLVRRKESDEALVDAISRLPDRRRRVVELRHRDGLSYADIASRLGINEPAARQIWSRAIGDLRKFLSGQPNAG